MYCQFGRFFEIGICPNLIWENFGITEMCSGLIDITGSSTNEINPSSMITTALITVRNTFFNLNTDNLQLSSNALSNHYIDNN